MIRFSDDDIKLINKGIENRIEFKNDSAEYDNKIIKDLMNQIFKNTKDNINEEINILKKILKNGTIDINKSFRGSVFEVINKNRFKKDDILYIEEYMLIEDIAEETYIFDYLKNCYSVYYLVNLRTGVANLLKVTESNIERLFDKYYIVSLKK